MLVAPSTIGFIGGLTARYWLCFASFESLKCGQSFWTMGGNTRQNEKRVIKECVLDILKDEDFISELIERVSSKVENLLNRKFAEVDTKLHQLEDVNKQLVTKTEMLEMENKHLNDAIDSLEQYSRRNTVRIRGLPSTSRENLEMSFIGAVKSVVDINSGPSCIGRCHPIGPAREGKQDVLVKFMGYGARRELLKNRKTLREKGIVVLEDLTKKRYNLLKSAREALGGKNVWIFDGNINCRVKDKKCVLKTDADLQSVING